MFGNFSGARTNVTDRRQTDERAMAYGEREREFKFAKTNYILFHSKNKNIFNRPAISIDDDNVNQVNQIKFLGIIINKTLSWTDHIPANTQTLGQTLAQRHSIHWGERLQYNVGPKLK